MRNTLSYIYRYMDTEVAHGSVGDWYPCTVVGWTTVSPDSSSRAARELITRPSFCSEIGLREASPPGEGWIPAPVWKTGVCPA